MTIAMVEKESVPEQYNQLLMLAEQLTWRRMMAVCRRKRMRMAMIIINGINSFIL